MNIRWIAGGLALFALLAPGSAFAAKLAGLQVDIGSGVDALVRGDIDDAIGETLADVKTWEWVSPSRARGALDPVVRDCFTVDCLTKAGASLDAEAGLRVRFSGESQIYDWTLEVFDLRDGALLESTQGAWPYAASSVPARSPCLPDPAPTAKGTRRYGHKLPRRC